MKLYDKKFIIYGICMVRSFGQPGNYQNTKKTAQSIKSDQLNLHKPRKNV